MKLDKYKESGIYQLTSPECILKNVKIVGHFLYNIQNMYSLSKTA
jgi:hypothetical protein